MEELEEFDDMQLSFLERRRIRQIEKRRQQAEAGGPDSRAVMVIRAVEFLVIEILISVLSVFAVFALAGKISSNIIVPLGFVIYMIYAGVSSYRMFWMIHDAKKYLIANLCGYAIMALVSVIVKAVVAVRAYSWIFMPMKVFLVFGVNSWMSLLISHIVIAVIIVAMIINARFDRFNELENEEDYEAEY